MIGIIYSLLVSICNNTKGDKYFPLINCTDGSNIIVMGIQYTFVDFPRPMVKISSMNHGLEFRNTIELLEDIYCGTTSRKIVEAGTLCVLIQNELIVFRSELLQFKTGNDIEKKRAKEKFKMNYCQLHPLLPSKFGLF